MKKNITILSLALLCIPHIFFSMNLPQFAQQTKTILSEEERITAIDKQINQRSSSYKGAALGFSLFNMPTAEALTLIKLAEKSCPPDMIDERFNELKNRNNFFAEAIEHFVSFASKNLALINASNLKTIENPKQQQPISELNQLPSISEFNKLPSSAIKAYIMNRALKQTRYTYDIILANQNGDTIHSFDICELTDQAATSSFDFLPSSSNPNNPRNSRFILWDLKTGKSILNFDEPNPINIIAFNPNGSCIATALYLDEDIIKIWCPKTGQLCYQLSSDFSIHCLSYSQPTGSMLAASCYTNSPSQYNYKQWVVNPMNTHVGELINSINNYDLRMRQSSFSGEKYRATHPCTYFTQRDQLHITKKDCFPLYLCMKAIDNTKNPEIKQIENSASFIALTDLERTKVYNEINKKRAIR